jgi:hypothetical protein
MSEVLAYSEGNVEIMEGIIEAHIAFTMGETEFALLRNFADEKGNIHIGELFQALKPLQIPAVHKVLNALATKLPVAVSPDNFKVALTINKYSDTGYDNLFLGAVHMKI